MAKAKKTSRKQSVTRRAWPPHLKQRLRQLRGKLRDHELDAMLVCDPHDIRYLTGFSGEDSWALLTRGTVVILSDSRFEEELSKICPQARAVIRKRPLSKELADAVRRSRIEKLAIQSEHLTLAQRKAIVKELGASTLKPVSGWLTEQRAAKDPTEVRAIRRAISIQEEAYEQTLGGIEPGMTEREVAALLEYNMRTAGADGTGFPTIVAAGTNASIPHYLPGDAKVKKNDVLLIDFGAQRDGYCGDLTRVVAFGRMPRRMREVYQLVREAQQAAIEAIGPGKSLKEVDAVARDIIEAGGYGDRFGHGLGHGMGLEVHEEPRLSPRAEGELKPGHVVTVEPGIYLPGVGGVRIEDDVLVTERGHRTLSALPSDLDSAII